MSYDLRDIEKVPIVGVAKKLGMELGFRGEAIHAECPFRMRDDGVHESLSLVFDRTSNTFQCLSCNFRGSVLELVCYVTQVGPSEAIEWIGKNFHLPGMPSGTSKTTPAPGEKPPKSASGEPGTARILNEVYNEFLRVLGGPSARAIEYMKGRGISVGTLEKHRITDIKGLHGTNNLLKEAYAPELLRTAGLLDATDNFWFEEYPLIFPYVRGAEVAFIQAHCMDLDKRPRYLRAREALPFLYNVDVLRTLADGDRVFLAEGIMDCLTLEEHGYHAVAIPSLNDFKPEWVSDFKGLQTYLVHSGDAAAERAVGAIALVFAKSDLAVRSIGLPRGHDVNSFFAQGGTQLDFEHLVWMAAKVKTSRSILEGETRGAMADFLEELREHQRRTKTVDRPFLGLDTGFRALAQVSEGLDPLGSGQLWVVTGPPGAGKTTFCLQMARQALENNEIAVLHVSYNEGKFLLRLKGLCQLSQMPATALLRGDVQADRLASAVERMSKWGKGFFVVEGNKTTTIDVICDYCQRVKSITGEPRVLLVVDHLEAIPFPEQNLQANARIEACASELHRLSRQLAIPIVAVSSTAMEQACSIRHSLNGYGRIEYSEDLMLLLEPDPEISRESPFESNGIVVRAHVVKNRHGGVGNVLFDFLPDCHYFREKGRAFPSPEVRTASPGHETEEIAACGAFKEQLAGV